MHCERLPSQKNPLQKTDSIKSQTGKINENREGRKKCGGRRIRTFEAEATDLQSVPFDRSGTPPALCCSELNVAKVGFDLHNCNYFMP